MNPMTNVKNIKKLSELELKRNLKTSWHDQYKDSAWIFVGGLPYDLTEGDLICVFSQYGEVVNINLIRDKGTGKSKGYCFLCYEDQRSTVLAVDNFNGVKLLGRTLRVDHVQDYKPPKDSEKKDVETRRLQELGCAPDSQISVEGIKKEKSDDKGDCVIIEKGPSITDLENETKVVKPEPKNQKKKKEKKVSKVKVKKEKESEKRKKRKTRRKSSSSSSDSSDDSSSSSSDSSSESSSEDSDSSQEKARAKKRRHKKTIKKRKKKPRSQEEASHENVISASVKRRKLEEKIKALEKALNSVRSGRNKHEQSN